MDKDAREKWQKYFKRKIRLGKKQDKIDTPMSKWKDRISIIQSIFTVFGLIGALCWFYGQGEFRPRAIVSQEVTHREIDGKNTWVLVSVRIRNIGKVPINIESGSVWVQRITPIRQELNEYIIFDDCIIIWPKACDNFKYKINKTIFIEPNEIDRKSYEFIIPHGTQTIKIYSYFRNPINSWKFWKIDKEIGWDEVTIYDLKRKEKYDETNS